MHTRSVRVALLTSLGLIPWGCAEQADGTRPEPSDRLAPCGESTPVPAEAIGEYVDGHTPVVNAGIATGIYQCDNGLLHRPEPVTCSSGLPRPVPSEADAGGLDGAGGGGGITQLRSLYGQYGPPMYDQCSADSACNAAPLGYCAPTFVGGPSGWTAQCHYGCLEDADCGEGFLCECGDPVGHCVRATCRSDADCGAGLKCAAWFTDLVCFRSQYYSCQSPEDECNTSADCASPAICSGDGGRRRCFTRGGVCGRPFLVRGEARLAPLAEASDWGAADAAPPASGLLTAAERQRVGEHWAQAALMEHASIAAFARFTLQLLQLGAPCELVERSQRAMLDETAHARACFELASRYLGAALGPGPLPLQAALDEQDLEQIVVLAFREGCVGETVATLEALEAREQACVEVRAVLDRIAVDELRHAELAWGFVRWALLEHPWLRERLGAELAQLEAELRSPRGDAETAASLVHGVLSARRREDLRREALSEVVLPCARQLLREGSDPHGASRHQDSSNISASLTNT